MGPDHQAEKERLCVVTVPQGEVTIVHCPSVGSQTTGTAVLRTRMAGGMGFLLPTSIRNSRYRPSS